MKHSPYRLAGLMPVFALTAALHGSPVLAQTTEQAQAWPPASSVPASQPPASPSTAPSRRFDMSQKYRLATVSGEEYTRCYQVVIDNPLAAAPVATFFEQRVLDSGSGPAIAFPARQCALPYDPEMVIAIRYPETGMETGQTLTAGEDYGVVYLAYLQAALERDAAESQEEEEI